MDRTLSVFSRGLPLALGLALGVVSGCHRDDRTNAISVDPSRSGSELNNTESKYYDGLPAISDDGSQVVFISGRDSVIGIGAVRKAYKSTWAKGAAPQAVSRVTATDIGNERIIKISPDGQWAALQVEKAGQYDLYLQDVAGKNPPVAITNDTLVEQGFSFSPDGKLLVWLKQTLDKSVSSAVVVAIGSGTAADMAQQLTVSAAADYVQQVFWIPAATGYTLAIGTANKAALDAGTTITKRSFSTPAAAASTSPSAWLSNYHVRTSLIPTATATMALMVRSSVNNSGGSDGTLTPQIGGWTPPPLYNTNAPVRSEPDYHGLDAASPDQRYNPTPGYDIAAATISNDGKTAFFLGRFFYHCPNDINDSFGSAFAIGPADRSVSPTVLSPRLTATDKSDQGTYVNAFDFASGGICDRVRGDGTTSRIDDKILEMAVMRSSTATNYRLVYTTTVSQHFDAYCNLKAADQEVWLLDVADGKQTFYPLSNNQASVTDDYRDAGICPWPLGIY